MVSDRHGKDGTTGHRFTYDVYGKVTSVSSRSGSAIADYAYDDRGFCLKKVDYGQNMTTWYVRDASGNIIATYTTQNEETELQEIPVYATGRIGMANNQGGYTYELTDHLGNVRVTFKKGTNGSEVLSAKDYYPFGMEMPGRTFTSEVYRFGYQGQYAEKDEETGYNAFELRLYDARIGRWLTTDPYGQHWSPYMAMGNNPLLMVDADGGLDNNIYLNKSSGKVTRIERNNEPNRFFDDITGKEYFLHDHITSDFMCDMVFDVGDKFLMNITTDMMHEIRDNAGIAENNYQLIKKGYSDWDFGMKIFGPLLYKNGFNLQMVDDGRFRTTIGDQQLAFLTFGNDMTLYNVMDGGNFMWGHMGRASGWSLNHLHRGAHLNEWFTRLSNDTQADQDAIRNGYNFGLPYKDPWKVDGVSGAW